MEGKVVAADVVGQWDSESMQASVRRRTWAVMLLGFAILFALVASLARWVVDTGQYSAAPVSAPLEAVTGVVLYREAGTLRDASADTSTRVFEQDTVSTGVNSTADLRLFDGSLVHMFPDSQLQVDNARIGRFNNAATHLSYTLNSGAVHMTIPQLADKPFTVNVATPQGAAAFVPGDYTIRVDANATRISVWDGRIAAAVGDQTIEASAGQKIVLGPDPEDYRLVPSMEDTLTNGDFSNGFVGWQPWEDREEGRPDVLGDRTIVYSTEEGAPPTAARFTRTSEQDTHNETGLSQTLNVDVDGARSIVLYAKVRVDDASLSGGGYLGTEYPMMIRIRYRDERGVDQIWETGFYYANPENRPTQLGEQIDQGTWTEYSVDLAQFKTPPEEINEIEVFGAGHTFDAAIADVQLNVD